MKKISWKRIGIALGVVMLGFWLLKIPLRHFELWENAHSVSENQSTRIELSPISDSGRIVITSEISLTVLGWTFQIPNSKVRTRTDKPRYSQIILEDGSTLNCFSEDSPGAKEDRAMDPNGTIFHPEDLRSDYDLAIAAVKVTSKDASFWSSNRSLLRTFLLLVEKMSIVGIGFELHTVGNAWMRGFESVASKGQNGSFVYSLKLFGLKDQKLWMMIRPANGGQRWINTLLDSIQPPSTNAPESGAAHTTPPAASSPRPRA
jgi:hypothetical protein